MKRFVCPAIVSILALTLVTACDNAGRDNVLGIRATGTVRGLVFFDWNGNREPGDSIVPVPGVGIRVIDPTTERTLVEVASDPEGIYRAPGLPVGRYRLVVDPSTISDTVEIVRIIDGADVTIPPGDSVSVLVALGFPNVSVSEARVLAAGTRLFVEGVALNSWQTFGDSTLHIAGSDGTALRALRVRQVDVMAGDGVRLRGAISSSEGQPVLDDVRAFAFATVGLPSAEAVSTATAGTADGGRLDAAQVTVVETIIGDTATVNDDFVLTVDDGSGPLTVVVDADINASTTSLVPGTVVNIGGLLVPEGPGVWMLKPRSESDLVVR